MTFLNQYRPAFHAARVQAVIAALQAAKTAYAPVGLGTAFAVAAQSLGESYGTVARSWYLTANLQEKAWAQALAASRAVAFLTRIPHSKDELARDVRVKRAELSIGLAVTAVAAATKYSPGWVGACEREGRYAQMPQAKGRKHQLYLVRPPEEARAA